VKLFVWENVLTDYSSGMIIALAPDLEAALQLAPDSAAIRSDMGAVTPEVIEVTTDSEPRFWHIWGGG
jgi:hypothetical protein